MHLSSKNASSVINDGGNYIYMDISQYVPFTSLNCPTALVFKFYILVLPRNSMQLHLDIFYSKMDIKSMQIRIVTIVNLSFLVCSIYLCVLPFRLRSPVTFSNQGSKIPEISHLQQLNRQLFISDQIWMHLEQNVPNASQPCLLTNFVDLNDSVWL